MDRTTLAVVLVAWLPPAKRPLGMLLILMSWSPFFVLLSLPMGTGGMFSILTWASVFILASCFGNDAVGPVVAGQLAVDEVDEEICNMGVPSNFGKFSQDLESSALNSGLTKGLNAMVTTTTI